MYVWYFRRNITGKWLTFAIKGVGTADFQYKLFPNESVWLVPGTLD